MMRNRKRSSSWRQAEQESTWMSSIRKELMAATRSAKRGPRKRNSCWPSSDSPSTWETSGDSPPSATKMAEVHFHFLLEFKIQISCFCLVLSLLANLHSGIASVIQSESSHLHSCSPRAASYKWLICICQWRNKRHLINQLKWCMAGCCLTEWDANSHANCKLICIPSVLFVQVSNQSITPHSNEMEEGKLFSDATLPAESSLPIDQRDLLSI